MYICIFAHTCIIYATIYTHMCYNICICLHICIYYTTRVYHIYIYIICVNIVYHISYMLYIQVTLHLALSNTLTSWFILTLPRLSIVLPLYLLVQKM